MPRINKFSATILSHYGRLSDAIHKSTSTLKPEDATQLFTLRWQLYQTVCEIWSFLNRERSGWDLTSISKSRVSKPPNRTAGYSKPRLRKEKTSIPPSCVPSTGGPCHRIEETPTLQPLMLTGDVPMRG